MKKLGLLFLLITSYTFHAQDTSALANSEQSAETSQADIDALLADAEKDTATLLDQKTEITEKADSSNKITSYGIFGIPLLDCGKEEVKLTTWSAFGFGIIGGLLALFFPCTFPMIPMTMSFFMKGSGDKKKGTRNAILYGFSIFLVYFLLSIPFNFGLAGDSLSNLSTNIWLNIFFFVIFIVFAFSLFGYFDISLPSGLANKLDSKSNAGDFIGIFFMALTLAIVSFSCTGPILGLVLGSLENSKYVTPAFSGFGIGLGLPFALFALFPNLLKSLPKSGSWLDVVKVVFGFIELAFAFKFLSNADLVMRWGLLKREPFVIIWMIIFLFLGLYLLGLFRFKKDSKINKTPITYVLAFLSLGFVGYLSTDFFGGDLRLISGFPPPKSYSLFHQPEKFEIVQNDYQKALDKAKAEGKLLMIDFTGWACVNCRRMEENVWVDHQVYDLMKNKFVLTSLYVDEKIDLPKDQQYYSPKLEKQVVTIGDKWADFQGANLNEFTQPQYAIIDPESGRIVNRPIGGYNESSVFKAFLDCGLSYKSK